MYGRFWVFTEEQVSGWLVELSEAIPGIDAFENWPDEFIG